MKKSTKACLLAGALTGTVLTLGSAKLFETAVLKRKDAQNIWTAKTRPQPYEKIRDCDREKLVRGINFIFDSQPKEIFITAKDGLRLCGHLIERENAYGLFLLFHGYRSNPTNDFAGAVETIFRLGYSILMVDQRAHGNSEGRFISFGVKERYDALAWCEYAAETFPGLPVVMDGVSMGASTVMMAAGLPLPDNVKALICDCGYTSPAEICRLCMKKWYHLPAFPLFYTADLFTRLAAGFSFRDSDAREALTRNKLPILIAHGTGDDFVPYEMGEENFAACTASDADFFPVKGAEHGMCYLVDEAGYLEKIKALFRKAGLPYHE